MVKMLRIRRKGWIGLHDPAQLPPEQLRYQVSIYVDPAQ